MRSSGVDAGPGSSGSSPRRRLREGGEGSYEDVAGYSRAIRVGSRISVSGTTAPALALSESTYDQTVGSLQRAIGAVEELGGTRDSIVRTRVFLAPGADWQAASAAHRKLLGDVAPANTMLYVGTLIGPGLLVEVEVDAEVLG